MLYDYSKKRNRATNCGSISFLGFDVVDSKCYSGTSKLIWGNRK